MVSGARVATVVLVDGDGRLVGALPPLEVETPWWQDAQAVVRAVRQRHGVEVTMLRLLEAELARGPGGAVTYLAECAAPGVAGAVSWTGRLDDHPLRMSWARPGGPARDLAWADAILEARGARRTGPAEQIRTWNLSSIWRLPVDGAEGGAVWIKRVPPFAAHEGRLLAKLRHHAVPRVLAHGGSRLMMAHAPGVDLYGAPRAMLGTMIELLVGVQATWIGRADELLAIGAPDWRSAALAREIASVVERTAGALSDADRGALEGFVAQLTDRLAAVADCGLPETLIHGDFHPGNLRSDGADPVLLDWSDCGIGHPMLDEAAFLDRIGAGDVPGIRAHWHRAWKLVLPSSDPARASKLLAPVAAARQAAVYRGLLDRIEPSEHPYHQADPAAWLARAAEIARRERHGDV